MNKRLFLALCLFITFLSQAQIHEIGVFGGGSNFIGDVGPTNYIKPNEPAFGLIYKWNRSPRHSWRFSFIHSKVSSNDADSDMKARQQRSYEFENSFKEASIGLEFNFFDFNLHDGKRKITPYVYTGISGLIYDEKYYNGLDLKAKTENQGITMAIPMIVGIKTNITDNLVLGVEAGARWSFSDNLDGSYPKNESATIKKFGNINNKDWYMFTGVTLTYTFGDKPCYCEE